MLKPLTICTNKVHEFTLFNIMINWQIANDIWTITKKNNSRDSIYFGLHKTEYEDSDIVIYNIILWRLNIKFGTF